MLFFEFAAPFVAFCFTLISKSARTIDVVEARNRGFEPRFACLKTRVRHLSPNQGIPTRIQALKRSLTLHKRVLSSHQRHYWGDVDLFVPLTTRAKGPHLPRSVFGGGSAPSYGGFGTSEGLDPGRNPLILT